MNGLRAIARTFWIGGMWGIGIIVTPVLFAALDKVTAGMVAGRLFAAIAWVGLVCSVFLMADYVMRQGARGLKQAPFWLLLGMLACIIINHFGVTPMIAALKAQMNTDLLTDDLKASIDAVQMAGIPLMTAPNDIYYAMLEERLPGHGQAVTELQARGILLDGTTENGPPKLLLQVFSQPLLGPVFFEFIQRKADEGFGEGNFKALFESLERDQIRRGTLKPSETA